jgi:hypothetical protein
MRPRLSCPLLLPHCCHCCHDMRTFSDLQLPFAPPTPIGALVRRAATLTLLGLRTKLLATDRSEPGFDVGGYQDRVGRVGGEEQIRRVLCKPELFRTQNAKGIMVA